jgi:hypothetical protein
VKRLSFLCLTHPHDDHYKGMSHLLETFRPDKVWLFGSMTHRRLCAMVAEVLQAGAESASVDVGDSEKVDELVRIFDLIEAEYEDAQRQPRFDVVRLQLGMPLLDLTSSPAVRVVSIGASGGRILCYERTLAKCFDSDGEFLAKELPSVNHNMVSGGLLVEYGQARIVLGGDIDTEAWEETVRNFPPERLASALVKVSHHGSTTGYCNGLWEILSPGRLAVAVITPYSSQGLPSAEGLAHISGEAKTTLCPSIKAAAEANEWDDSALDTGFKGLSVDALLTLRAVFPKASRPSDRLEGICSFFITEDGNVTHAFTGEAGRLC